MGRRDKPGDDVRGVSSAPLGGRNYSPPVSIGIAGSRLHSDIEPS